MIDGSVHACFPSAPNIAASSQHMHVASLTDTPHITAWPEICDRFMIWPWPAYANPQLSPTSPNSRTSTCTHRQLAFIMFMGSQEKEIRSFSSRVQTLKWLFLESFFPSNPVRATSFFVCLRRLCLRRSPGVTQVLRLSLSVSHTLSLFQVRSKSLRFF